MKNILLPIVGVSMVLGLNACSKDTNTEASIPKTQTQISAPQSAQMPSKSAFSSQQARENLSFAKNQYIKLMNNVESKTHLHEEPECAIEGVVCFPRAEEQSKIHMEKPLKWTNGFYQGVIWQLLASKSMMGDFSKEEEAALYKHVSFYQDAIISESFRKSTHDLGFLLYDSFGEALRYDGLTAEQKKVYNQALVDGRESLATRYSDEKKLIKSWDWKPRYFTEYIEGGEEKKDLFHLRDPWAFPVIVDNMMNLDFMLAGDNPAHHTISYNHALNTKLNHYFFSDTDTQKQYPIAYHVFDYGEMKPGNWQGVGNISAWARGQGWGFYGFVTVAEAAKKSGVSVDKYTDFEAFADTLFGSLTHLMKNDPVPPWDFFAGRADAYKIAENVSDETAVYSHILDLCDYRIADNILPYEGYRPITYDANILSDESLAALKKVTSIKGEPLIRDGKVVPCGTQPYDLTDRVIPRDASAAALIASGAYRFAQMTDDKTKREKYIAFGDRIMAEISNKHLTKHTQDKSYTLGFVMENATGNLPNFSEIDVPIVYGDFYFVEANIRKIQLEQTK